jgi:hypothetical protein
MPTLIVLLAIHRIVLRFKTKAINANTPMIIIPFNNAHAFVFLIHTRMLYNRNAMIIISMISVQPKLGIYILER